MLGHRFRIGRLTAFDLMHSASKAWPSRLLAVAVALALAVAYVIGAYAHAAGHQHEDHLGVVADALDHADHVAVAAAPDGDEAPGQPGGAHDEDSTGHSLDCYDTICHGGQAILAAAPVLPAALRAAPSIESAAALHGADHGGLDRPPKPFRSA
jgi:hypothetical protein